MAETLVPGVRVSDVARRWQLHLQRLALGAKGVLLGRAYIYALAAGGQRGVSHLLELFAADMKATMTLIGAKSPADIMRNALDFAAKELSAGLQPKRAFVPKAVGAR